MISLRPTRSKSLLLAPLLIALSLLTADAGAADKSAASKNIKIEKGSRTIQEHPMPLEVSIDKSVNVSFDEPAASIFIANPDVADVQVVSPTSVMVYGKKDGQTTLRISNNAGKVLVYKTVMVSQNLAGLREALRAVIPGHNIQVEAIPNGIVLTGTASDPSVVEDARRLATRYVPKEGGDVINRIKVKANNQVQIRVRFAEVARGVDKRFGINWENVISSGGFAFGLATGADFVSAGSTSFTRTIVGTDTNDAFATSFNNRHVSVNSMVDALAKDGLVTILAEPSLSAMSGETASFLAGGEFPIPVPQSGDTITIEWKNYGVSLAFTPTIISDNRINLHVRPEVSQLSDTGAITLNNIVVPALTTRRAETTIELNSGQSFAIAGLLNNQQTQSVKKFPFLGDVPVLGPLFRSTRFQNDESELVIIITPYVVKPSTEERLGLPTDGFSAPSDTDLMFRMRQTNSDPNARTISGEPRAVRVEEPMAEDSPAPEAAPLPPVSNSRPMPMPMRDEPSKPMPAAPMSTPIPPLPESKQPMPTPTATTIKTNKPSPIGPGGFIME